MIFYIKPSRLKNGSSTSSTNLVMADDPYSESRIVSLGHDKLLFLEFITR